MLKLISKSDSKIFNKGRTTQMRVNQKMNYRLRKKEMVMRKTAKMTRRKRKRRSKKRIKPKR